MGAAYSSFAAPEKIGENQNFYRECKFVYVFPFNRLETWFFGLIS